MPYTALPMVFFAHPRCGECTCISFTGATTIDVCDIHRIRQHRDLVLFRTDVKFKNVFHIYYWKKYYFKI